MSPIRAGFAYGSAGVGLVAAAFAVFNWVVDQWELPLGTLTGPIVGIYNTYLADLIEWVRERAAWAIPDWNHHFIALTVILAAVTGRYEPLFSPEDYKHKQFEAWVLPLLGAATVVSIPYLNYVFTAWTYVLVLVALVAPFLPAKSFGGNPTMRRAGLYTWGCIGGAMLMLALNLYY